jgi:general L-amino acid transport system permease protein
VTLMRRFWRAELLAAWLAVLVVIFTVLRGGVLGLSPVPVRLWSGLLLTVWLSVFGIAAGYPLGLALALGRRSVMPLVRWFSVAWIELVRGVPLVSILIMASVVLPLFLPEGIDIDNLFRAQVAFTMFASAYLAEVFRGGLQAVPVGQYEGAQSLGLGYWQTLRLIVLPQALKLVIPAQVNTFIAIFKDTSLVLVIGLFDFLGTIKAMLSDANWLGFSTEGYLFGASVYFLISYGMSRYSRHLEHELNPERMR